MAWRIFLPARTFVGQASQFILCLGSELVTELAFGKLDCIPKSFWSVVLMFGTVQNSPSSLEMCWLKLKAHVLPVLEILYMRLWKMKMLKLCFFTYVKKGKSNEMLKYPLKGIRKGPKSNG